MKQIIVFVSAVMMSVFSYGCQAAGPGNGPAKPPIKPQSQPMRSWLPNLMTPTDMLAAEGELQEDPDDLNTRCTLLEYYLLVSMGNFSPRTPPRQEFEEKREQHVLWLIDHHPECSCLSDISGQIDLRSTHYVEAKSKWLQQAKIHAKEVPILVHASKAMEYEPKLSRELAIRALGIRPADPQLLRLVAEAYTRALHLGDHSEQRQVLVKQALQAWEQYLASQTYAVHQWESLIELAPLAFEAGDFAKAQRYATKLLEMQSPPNDFLGLTADGLHTANTILGRLALRRSDIEEAKHRLLASAPVTGSPRLTSYGPRMDLAAELLDLDERWTVLAYLDKCAKYWPFGPGQIKEWEDMIRSGKKPDLLRVSRLLGE